MTKRTSLLMMILLYVGAGINHFIHTEFYLSIMPYYLPYPLQLVYVSGLCELLFGLLLIPYKTRKVSSWLIVAMLVVFLTVHVQMIIDTFPAQGMRFWISVFRLPLQYVLIRWAWIVSRKYNYPVLSGSRKQVSGESGR